MSGISLNPVRRTRWKAALLACGALLAATLAAPAAERSGASEASKHAAAKPQRTRWAY